MQKDFTFKSLFKNKMSLKHESENCNPIEAIGLQRLLQDAPHPTLGKMNNHSTLLVQSDC